MLRGDLLQEEPLSPHVPTPPVYATVEEERQHRKTRLAATHRVFARYGFDEGIAGHISARDPEHTDTFWVGPFGHHFSELRASSLIRVDEQGEVIEGDGAVNIAAFVIHSRVHKARPDVVAVAHAHSVAGKAWASLGRLLDPITQESCVFFEDHELSDPYNGLVFDVDEGDRIAKSLSSRKALVLRNHGLLTVGRTVEEAAWWMVALDDCCRVQLAAEAVGAPTLIDPDVARATRQGGGTPQLGWFKFEPLWRSAVRTDPDLVD
ncbi:MAG TPA: class II aldolase/adducin family protein [Acidimicrobiales bacterium]|nr:class II aldolase/adducin family protein [Acidimicrobiales bacterium]